MKKLIPVLLVLFAACSTPPSDGYILNGKINGKTPAKIFLQEYYDGKMLTIDSSEFINGEFHFEGTVDFPQRFFLKVGDKKPMQFFIENSEITITGNIDSLRNLNFEGSTIHDKFMQFNKLAGAFDNKLNKVHKKFKKEHNKELSKILENKLDSIFEAKTNFIKEYIKTNGNCVLAPFLINQNLIYTIELDELEELTNSISPDLKDSKYTQKLIKRISLLRTLQPGNPAPLFTQNDTKDNPVNLSDFKGKYLLIDFWASWCGPCRRANPTIVETYNKYKNKNFTILGISLDGDKSKWLGAIEKDNLTWTHVSTLEGWANPVSKQYGVASIPHAILIDPEGNIVKRGIHAEDLDELLSGLLN